MSEYQYYEFLAIDRALSDEDMEHLRSISTRASITSTSFTNEYEWGDLKVNPLELVSRYFDVFVYYSNWGSRRVAFRFPRDVVDESQLAPFMARFQIVLSASEEFLILDILYENEEDRDWDWEFEGWMAELAPVRDELISGDLRPLYIAWLMAAQSEQLDEDDLEPPVPPGLRSPTSAQEQLARFLRVDEDLLTMGAEASAELLLSHAELAEWITDLPAREKDRLLFDVATGKQRHVGTSLIKQFRKLRAVSAASVELPAPRRVRTLLDEALMRSAELERERQRRKEEERQRRAAEAARTRAEYLTALGERESAVWDEVERLVSSMKPRAYDQVVVLLCDLRDLALHQDAPDRFAMQLAEMRQRHQRKSSFMARLLRAGLDT